MTTATDNTTHSTRIFTIAIVFLLIVVFCASVGLVLAHQQLIRRQTGDLEKQLARGPHVLVTQISAGNTSRKLDLPASIHGYIETPVYAKIAGYMKAIKVDKGDRIKTGQLIATIDSPETDKAVSDAKANYWLRAVTDRRNQQLVRQQVIPQQTADDSHAAMLQAWDAYQQQRALQAYEIVQSPFDAIVTARYVDPGTLIPESTASAGTNYPIVSLASLAPLRIYAYAPQSSALFIRDGDPAAITVSELPGRLFTGTITRHPQALDQATRTMLVEVDLPNSDRSLYPGMYANMHLKVGAAVQSVRVPDDALIFRNNEIYVPIVRDDRLNLTPVQLGHDNGYTVEVLSKDLHAGDLIAVNVGEAARNGEPVQPVVAKQDM